MEMASAGGEAMDPNLDDETGNPEGVTQDAVVHASSDSKATTVRSSRKRTKTGCLTCRRRRIKCGEERPICNNCVKSKRECEGYSQRVVFKDPMSGFAHGALGLPTELSPTALRYPHQAAAGSAQLGMYEACYVPGHPSLPAIAPRPPPSPHYVYGPAGAWPPADLHAHATATLMEPLAPGTTMQAGSVGFPSSVPAQYGQAYGLDDGHLLPVGELSPTSVKVETRGRADSSPTLPPGHGLQAPRYAQEASLLRSSPAQAGDIYVSSSPTATSAGPARSQMTMSRLGTVQGPNPYPQGFGAHRGLVRSSSGPAPGAFAVPQAAAPRYLGQMGLHSPHGIVYPAAGPTSAGQLGHSAPPPYMQSALPPTFPTTSFLDDEVPESAESDMDDDQDISSGIVTDHVESVDSHSASELAAVMALQAGTEERPIRTITDFVNAPNMLATYRPTPLASQLMNPLTARIFGHFVSSTGPNFSIYERLPANPSAMFSGGPVPSSQQGLWTYKLPMLALRSPPLMHAMLALGALHISKLQGASKVQSLKHYHIALRRVAKQVSLPAKRGELAALAATLLLGFWEVMAAEHAKWNSHLMGARQLLDEYDFAGMTKRIKALRAQREAERTRPLYSGAAERGGALPASLRHPRDDYPVGSSQEINEDFVSFLMGRQRQYDEYGRAIDPTMNEPFAQQLDGDLSRQEIEDYEIRQDLFWWFAKQDVYQSVLSGNRLLSNYERWGHCPPRAAIGRRDAIYGTSDHLILLLGRLAEFSAKDQRRKRRVMDANGGRWRPPPGMDLGMPPQAAPQPSSGAAPAGHFPPGPAPPAAPMEAQGPPMYGMIPSTGERHMPSAFMTAGNMSPASTGSDDVELDAATAAAEEEWHEIRRALVALEASLGPEFQPLSAEYMQPRITPFGTSLHYRTYAMACVWSLYYCAHIILERSHPSMPAIAMMAAGVAAPKTAAYANDIGRIAAGLFPTDLRVPLNPTLAAALIESSLSLFFAGVQYQDARQRAWTANSLRTTAQRTGWDSILAIAVGCELAWVKAAQVGRGPPYVPNLDPTSRDDRLAMRATYNTSGSTEDGTDRGFSWMNPGMRVHWAVGLLGVDEDLEHMTLHD